MQVFNSFKEIKEAKDVKDVRERNVLSDVTTLNMSPQPINLDDIKPGTQVEIVPQPRIDRTAGVMYVPYIDKRTGEPHEINRGLPLDPKLAVNELNKMRKHGGWACEEIKVENIGQIDPKLYAKKLEK